MRKGGTVKVDGPGGVVAAAAAVAVMALATGCSSSNSGGAHAAHGSEALKPLTAAQLKRAGLTADEVKGFAIEHATEKGVAGDGVAKADKAPCRPLAVALGSRPSPKPKRSLVDTFAKSGTGNAKPSASDSYDGLMGTVRVATYAKSGAEKTVKELQKAVGDCARGFTMTTGEGERQSFSAVQAMTAPKLGDEAIAYRLVNSTERAPSLVAVVRSGPTLTMLFVTSLTDPDHVEIPQELLKAQVDKVVWARTGKGPAPKATGTDQQSDSSDDEGDAA